MSTAAIILCAGESVRMGQPKALVRLPTGGDFLGALCARYDALGISPWAVTGAHADAIAEAHPSTRRVVNAAWRSGQLESIRRGLVHVLLEGATGAFLHPVDAPLVQPATLAVLQRPQRARAAVPTWRGERGHPVWLPRAVMRDLLQTDASSLADWLLRQRVEEVPVDDAGVKANINTPGDLQRLLHGA